MRWIFSCVTVAVVCVAVVSLSAAQDPPAKNPLEGNADAIRGGMGLYRARCADCHGMDARGVRAPDITQVWASGRTDAGLFKTVKEGVPGTEMPSNPRVQDAEAWQILAYLRTLAAPAPTDPPRGDAVNGERIFRANCAVCHRVKGAGGCPLKEAHAQSNSSSPRTAAGALGRHRSADGTADASSARHSARNSRRPDARRLALAHLRRQLQQPAA